MNRKAVTIIVVSFALLTALTLLSPPSYATTERIYSTSTIVTNGIEVTSHTLSHLSDDQWYQINATHSQPSGQDYAIDVSMFFSTTLDPTKLTQIDVFSEAHVTYGTRPVVMYIYNYSTLLWESLFSVSSTSDASYIYSLTANLANYVGGGGEMRLRVYYKVSGNKPQEFYQDYTYIELSAPPVGPLPPVARFTYAPDRPLVDQPVNFDASTSSDPDGTVVSYRWDFGDANVTIVTVSNITHAYTATGTYNVNLTVTDDAGLTNSTVKSVKICVPPVASFTYSSVRGSEPASPHVGDTVSFDGSASSDSDGTITDHAWDFETDGVIDAHGEIASHPFPTTGIYNVTLTVTDNDELTDATWKTILVIAPPDANFTYTPERPLVDETVTLDASSSTPNGGTITDYAWDFETDGVIDAHGVIVTHPYPTAASHNVTLVVTDSEGLSDSAWKLVKVYAPPVADFYYYPIPPALNEPITFNASLSLDLDGTITDYAWDFETDGVIDIHGMVVEHTFTLPMAYNVTLIVTDNDSLTDSTWKLISLGVPPTASFIYSPPNPLEGEVISFDASASTPNGGTITDYAWDFETDGFIDAHGMIVDHAFPAHGTYNVTLTVTDSEALSDSDWKLIRVYAEPVASFTYSSVRGPEPTPPNAGDDVSFDASASSDADGTITGYAWDFESDGIVDAYGETVSHPFLTTGIYNVTLTVADNDNLTDTTWKLVTVISYPKANFTYIPAEPSITETVSFDASSSTPNGGTITDYAWDFETDGVIDAYGVVADHVYMTPGTYNVTLTVADSEGLSDVEWKLVTVYLHDIAVLSVDLSSPKVYQGNPFNVTVVVKNEGTATETFDVTVNAYNTTSGLNYLVDTVPITLTPGQVMTLDIPWGTTLVRACTHYTVKAEVTILPKELDTGDNSLTTVGTVKVKIMGDVNEDGLVDVFDLILIGLAFGSKPGDPNYDPEADLSQVGPSLEYIDIFDLIMAALNYGKTC